MKIISTEDYLSSRCKKLEKRIKKLKRKLRWVEQSLDCSEERERVRTEQRDTYGKWLKDVSEYLDRLDVPKPFPTLDPSGRLGFLVERATMKCDRHTQSNVESEQEDDHESCDSDCNVCSHDGD